MNNLKYSFASKDLYGDKLYSVKNIAPHIGMGRNKLYKFLKDKQILTEDRTPYFKYDHLIICEEIHRNNRTLLKPYFTEDGLLKLVKILRQERYLVNPRRINSIPRSAIKDRIWKRFDNHTIMTGE